MYKTTEKINIVIEGMDGGGKRTVAEGLERKFNKAPVKINMTDPDQSEQSWYWEQQEREYNLVSFPEYDSISGELIKDYLFSRTTMMADLESVKRDSLLYSLNRFETLASLYPNALRSQNPKGFIFDRYTTSNILYQTMNLSLPDKIEYIKWLKDIEYNLYCLPKPDKVVVLISTSDKLIQDNIEKRGREQDFLETVEHQAKVRENILFMVEHEGWVPIIVNQGDEMRPREIILDEVYKSIIGG